MSFLSEIGGVEFFTTNSKPKNKEAQTVTTQSIAELISKGVLSKKEAARLQEAYTSGAIDFGDDGLTKEEIQNFTEDAYKTLMKQYKNEKKSFKSNSKLIENFEKNGYDKQKDIIAFQTEMNKDRNYIHTDAGKKHLERVSQNMKQQEPAIADIKDKVEELQAEMKQKVQQNPLMQIKTPQLANLDTSLPSVSTKLAELQTPAPVQKAENTSKQRSFRHKKVVTKTLAQTTPPPFLARPTETTARPNVENQTAATVTPVKTNTVPPAKYTRKPQTYYTEPQNTKMIALKDLKVDQNGRYVVPAGNYSINASELPANEAKFNLAKGSNLVIKGKIDKKNNCKSPESYSFTMKNSDPKNAVYKKGDFEIDQRGRFIYKGKEINPDEWETKVVDIASKNGSNKSAGTAFYFVKKSTIPSPKDYKESSIDVTGDGSFYAQDVRGNLTVNCNQFKLGNISEEASVSIEGNGSVDNINIADTHTINLNGKKGKINVGNIQSGMIMGKNVQVDILKKGEFLAQGTISSMQGGKAENDKLKIGYLTGGTVNNAQSITCMNGGKIDLYKRRNDIHKETIINSYIAGHVESCDGSVITIKDGLLADSGILKRGGKIVTPNSAANENVFLATTMDFTKPNVFEASMFPFNLLK